MKANSRSFRRLSQLGLTCASCLRAASQQSLSYGLVIALRPTLNSDPGFWNPRTVGLGITGSGWNKHKQCPRLDKGASVTTKKGNSTKYWGTESREFV